MGRIGIKKSIFWAVGLMLSLSGFGIEPICVSTKGSDSGTGTLTQPFLTIEKARDDIRLRRSSGEKGIISILLRGGIYHFSRTVSFDKSDKDLIFKSYGNEKVRFTGGSAIAPSKVVPVTGSSKAGIFPENSRKHIFMVRLRDLGITDYGNLKQVGFGNQPEFAWMELFINGKPAHLSRWPNDSTVLIQKVINKGSVLAEGDKGNIGGKFSYNGNRPSRWKSPEDIWISGYFHYGWADDALKLASVDTVAKSFSTTQPHMYGFFAGSPWNAWYAYNIPEEIDCQGEYYIDRKEGILYFYNNEPLKTVEVSLLEKPLVSINEASGIIFEGITFECSRGVALEIKSSSDCVVKNCTLRNMGSYAAGISDNPGGPVGKNNGIQDCSIYQTGAGGIHLGGGNRQTLEEAGNYVENCTIHDYNRISKTYCAGVQIMDVGNRISHCEIFDAPHFAIQLSGNDHLIEYNNIHDVCLVTDDVGALYYGRNPSERGHVVQFNYFHNISDIHSSSAIYHDDGACGMKVFGNVFYKAGSKTVLIGGGSDNPYVNNIFIDCKRTIDIDDRLQSYDWAMPWIAPGNLFEKNLNDIRYNQPPYSIKYPELAKYWHDNPGLPKRNIVDKNVFVRIGEVCNNFKRVEFSKNNLVVNEDPGFVSEKDQNFKLKSTSEIFIKIPGFKPIPFEEIGIVKTVKQ
jgi:hypothetical protein